MIFNGNMVLHLFLFAANVQPRITFESVRYSLPTSHLKTIQQIYEIVLNHQYISIISSTQVW